MSATERAFYTLRCFLPYTASTSTPATYFYQGFPGSLQFFLEGCSASYFGSKQAQPICLLYLHSLLQTR